MQAQKETALGAAVDMTEGVARYDAYAKHLIAQREVFARILQSCVPGFAEFDVQKIESTCLDTPPQIGTVSVGPAMLSPSMSAEKVATLNGEDTVPGEGLVRFDVFAEVYLPGESDRTKVYVNVEAQGRGQTGLTVVRRAQFYVARELSRQYGVEFTSPHYEQLKRACSVWLLLEPPRELKGRVVTASFGWNEGGLPVEAPRWTGEADLMTVVMVGLTDDGEYTGVARMLGVLFSERMSASEKKVVLHDKFGLEMSRELKGGVSDMGSFGEVLVRNALERGERKGREQGVEQGMEQGVLMLVRNFMASTGAEPAEAMDVLGVPEEMRPVVAERLQASPQTPV